jgi:hypothetical protein
MNPILENLLKTNAAPCGLCPEAASTKKVGKQQKRKGGGAAEVHAKADKADIWFCLVCGQ